MDPRARGVKRTDHEAPPSLDCLDSPVMEGDVELVRAHALERRRLSADVSDIAPTAPGVAAGPDRAVSGHREQHVRLRPSEQRRRSVQWRSARRPSRGRAAGQARPSPGRRRLLPAAGGTRLLRPLRRWSSRRRPEHGQLCRAASARFHDCLRLRHLCSVVRSRGPASYRRAAVAITRIRASVFRTRKPRAARKLAPLACLRAARPASGTAWGTALRSRR